MSSYTEEDTFLDKIKAKRAYADRQSSSSSDSSRAETSVRTSSQPYTGVSVKSYIRQFSASDMEPDNNFRSMVADPASESEEENDKLPTCIDVASINGPSDTERPDTNLPSEIKDHHCNTPNNTSTLPCDLFFIDDESTIQRFNNFDEISEYLVNASVTGRDDRATAKQLNKLTKVPLRIVDHYITIGTYLKRLYEHDFLMDVIIDVSGHRFNAHRIALCCYSDYFAELFRKSNGRKIPFEVRINGVSADAFAAFLEFCYTGELNVYPEIASDILIVADYLKVRALKAKCDLVTRNLPLEHAVKIMVKTNLSPSNKLYNSLYSNILADFSAASKIDTFLELDVETFCKLIQSDDLDVTSEYELFTVVIRWIVHNVQQRVKHTVRVMAHVRFSQMTQKELFMCAETTSLVRGYDKFREMILIANWIISTAEAGREDSFNFPRSKPRNCFQQTKQYDDSTANESLVMPPPIMTSTPKSEKASSPVDTPKHTSFVDILVVGGFVADQANFTSNDVDKYDVEDNQWLHFCGLPSQRRHHAVVTLDNDIYMIGGCEPYDQNTLPNAASTVYRMNLVTKKWTQIADMNVHRYGHGACTVDGLIYVIGGKGKHNSVLFSVEIYDPITDVWEFAPSLPEPLYATSVAALGNKIYVAGGLSSSDEIPSTLRVLSSVYCYDTSSSRSWKVLNALRFPRCHASLVNVNERLFLCGGATRTHCVQNSVLCSTSNIDEYNPDNDSWIHDTDMVIPRHDAGVAVAGSRIYIIGGISLPADRILQTVECYDTTSSAWIPGVQDLPCPARWICCCSVRSRYHRPSSSLSFE